jgi:hypothetical protein
LALRISCPLLSRDAIKEGMVASRPDFVPTTHDPLTMRTYEVFFAAIELMLRAEVTLVAEAAFSHPLWSRGLDPLTPLADLRVIRCRVDPAEARRRMQQRLLSEPSRAAHADAEHLSSAPAFEPLSLAVATLDVETSLRYDPNLAAITAFCRR